MAQIVEFRGKVIFSNDLAEKIGLTEVYVVYMLHHKWSDGKYLNELNPYDRWTDFPFDYIEAHGCERHYAGKALKHLVELGYIEKLHPKKTWYRLTPAGNKLFED